MAMKSPTFGEAFIRATEEALEPLHVVHGFIRCAPRLDERLGFFAVKYVRDPDYVSFSTAPQTLELDLRIGTKIGETQHEAELWELQMLSPCKIPPVRRYGIYELYRHPEVEKLCEEYSVAAGILFNCGQRFFDRDTSLWSDLQTQRENIRSRQAREELSRQAEAAFKRGDWRSVIKCLEKLGSDLSPLQQKRLEYARRKHRWWSW